MKLPLALPAFALLFLAAAPCLAQAPGAEPPAAPPPAAQAAPAVPAPAPAPAFPIPQAGGDAANQVELVAGLCGVQMKSMSPLACRCLAERSMVDLSAPQRDYLVATAVSPPVADRMLADKRVGQADQGVIFRFLDAASDACASGVYRPAPASAAAAPGVPAPAVVPPAAPAAN